MASNNTKDIIGEQQTLDSLIDGSITELIDSDVSSLRNYAFFHCPLIERVRFPKLQVIGNNVFSNCIKLREFYVGTDRSSVTSLSSNSGLGSGSSRPTIYVNESLLSQYKEDSNWSKLAGWIFKVGDEDALVWDETEIDDSENEIAEKVSNGTAMEHYKLGQYKTINFGTRGNIRWQIIAKNTDELLNGGNAQLTWFPMEALDDYHMANPTLIDGQEGTGTVGGYNKSELRRYLNEDIWSLFPEVWQSMIKEVKKYSTGYNADGTLVKDMLSSEKIWVPSVRELSGIGSKFNSFTNLKETSGVIYDLAFYSGGQITRCRGNSQSTCSYWLRTAASVDKKQWVTVYENYNATSRDSSSQYICITPCFCT